MLEGFVKPYYSRPGCQIFHGDAREVLPELDDKSVHCVVTSPPYWGLRDYGTAEWKGGDPACGHKAQQLRRGVNLAQSVASTRGEAKKCAEVDWIQFRDKCEHCGAVRMDSQLGLERTPAEYVAKMVDVFREVWRVLRDDGTLWLNMGDCYATGAGSVGECPGGGARGAKWAGSAVPPQNNVGRGRGVHTAENSGKAAPRLTAMGPMTQPNRMPVAGLKPKDLVGMPWRLAFALQADGWYLRSDIIWAKCNPMPESVTDRPTKSHEYIFLLSKSERYYYDAEAIKEACESGPSDIRKMLEHKERIGGKHKHLVDPYSKASSATNIGQKRSVGSPDGRNKRTVWTISTAPFPDAHFATFPEDLIKPCILAGCPKGGVVLDPFMGSGTTALVASKLQCMALGIELNAEYIDIAARRLSQEVFQF